MNERAIFLEALDKEDSTERSAFLDTVCAGDDALRQRVEALLKSHVEAGSFLGKLAPERVAEELANRHTSDETLGETPKNGNVAEDLDFLAPSDKPGSVGRLSHYEVQEVIGRGGMGIVLKAFDEKLHRVVAIKVMAAQLATNATARKRFAREAQAAAAVSHDHLVTIYAVEEADPRPYLVMQYVAGLSLQQRLDREGPLELPEILRIGMQTASALAAAHAQGLIHRDIKPANILLENGVERVKVTDFGLMRAFADASLTQEGVVAGTPQYMAPEQARGEPVDQRTDLFSLGSVLYVMCTGRTPFRASGSMAVLKRVCEETPTPIGETNPEIPDWLVAIIEKLHAKDPAQRFQSAAEVADLLSRHLAHVQHPSVVGQVSNLPADQTAGLKPAPRRRRLAIATAVIVLLVGSLSLTEATGVTNVRATVIRIFTPDGTLVVETDDPAVKIMIEGDGGLVITGAGLEEIRLRPGNYRVQTDRAGKPVPLDKNLVEVTRGGRAIVKVKVEAATVVAAAKAEKGAFVHLGGQGVAERKFDTLAEAVLPASNGDIIEIRGNGPFVTPPISLGNRALTLRAASGFHPVIRLNREGTSAGATLLTTNSSLVLEGLELGLTDGLSHTGFPWRVMSGGPSVSAVNCRFHWSPYGIFGIMSRIGRFRNCEFVTGTSGVLWQYPNDGALAFDNCVQAGGGLVFISYRRLTKETPQVHVAHCTVRALAVFTLLVQPETMPVKAEAGALLRLAVSESVIDVNHALRIQTTDDERAQLGQLAERIDSVLPNLLAWRDRQNLYAEDNFDSFVALFAAEAIRPPSLRTLAGWDKTWGQSKTESFRGRVRYHGGDPLAGQMTPDDFRLRSDSAGYRAGKDGKDLGADVDLVGPGKAYERWKKTPEYQQWLKDTGQVKK